MTSTERKTVLMRVLFSEGNLAKPALEHLSRDRALSMNILRGRITQEDASFDLEVSVPPKKIENFLRRTPRCGASVGSFSMGVT